jgi:hypothetical protein
VTIFAAAGTTDVSHSPPYQLLADLVLSLHFAIVLFVVGGLAVIVFGSRRGWRIADALWFRLVHLAAITVVVAQAWLGVVCPLTTLEMWLRMKARDSTYSGNFIEHWVHRLMYFDAPPWVFAIAYSLFGLAVLAAWWYFPPKSGRRVRDTRS